MNYSNVLNTLPSLSSSTNSERCDGREMTTQGCEVLDEFPHAHETKHEHRTHSYDKTCPDCGEDNPDFEPDQYLCSSCGEPVGTKEETIKSVACPHCGENEGAENKAEGWTF